LGGMNRPQTRSEVIEGFWARVNKDGPLHPVLGTRCWIFGSASPDSPYYGKVSERRNGERATISTHCFSWELHNGAIPEGLCVCHHCDVRPCCNPGHLFLGTHGDNIRDAVAKRRLAPQARTHCPRGHPLAGDNLVRRGGNTRHRDCKTCHRERELARVYATPGLMDEKARMAREWRVKNPEKAKAQDDLKTIRRRERNRAKHAGIA
jgi:hypothetical protein